MKKNIAIIILTIITVHSVMFAWIQKLKADEQMMLAQQLALEAKRRSEKIEECLKEAHFQRTRADHQTHLLEERLKRMDNK